MTLRKIHPCRWFPDLTPRYFYLVLGLILVFSAHITTVRADNSPNRSTSIAMNAFGNRLLVVNRETHSLSVFFVTGRNGKKALRKLAEIPVGRDPQCVAVIRNSSRAYVTNSASGTVSVVKLVGGKKYSVIKEISVGTEPRGCALSIGVNLTK